MGDTTISWTDKTWNCLRGCSRVSEGCRNCYAEKIAARFSDPGGAFHGFADRSRKGSKWTGRVELIRDKLHEPLVWRAPKKVFVNSMSDAFHEALSNEEIAAMFGIMAMASQHTFQVLTKRAQRMREWFEWLRLDSAGPHQAWDVRISRIFDLARRHAIPGFDHSDWVSEFYKVMHTVKWPLPNVWLGVSVENQAAADERIPDLLRTPAAVRFLSCEPLIGLVDLLPWLDPVGACDCPPGASYCVGGCAKNADWRHTERDGDDPSIGWVIAGCESGPGARPCDTGWLQELRDRCGTYRVPFFLKQALWKPPITIGLGSRSKGHVDRVPVLELPYLDGVQHAAFPEARP